MTLTTAAKPEFLTHDRQRGEAPFMASRLDIREVGSTGVLAVADGSMGERYLLAVDFSDFSEGYLGVYCDCPRFEEKASCKHLWALLQKLEREFELPSVDRRLHLAVVDPADVEIGKRVRHRSKAPRETKQNTADVRDGSKTRERATWETLLQGLASARGGDRSTYAESIPPQIEEAYDEVRHWFVLSVADELNRTGFHVTLMRSVRKQDGEWSRPASIKIKRTGDLRPAEKSVVALLSPINEGGTRYYNDEGWRVFSAPSELLPDAIEKLHETQRFAWKLGDSRQHFEDAQRVTEIEIASPYQVRFHLGIDPTSSKQIELKLQLFDEMHCVELESVIWVSTIGCALVSLNDAREPDADTSDPGARETVDSEISTRLVRLNEKDAVIASALHGGGTISVPRRNLKSLMTTLSTDHSDIEVTWSEELKINRKIGSTKARCVIEQAEYGRSNYTVAFEFVYEDHVFSTDSTRQWWFDAKSSTVCYRDSERETALLAALPVKHFKPYSLYKKRQLEMDPREFVEVVESLQTHGWEVVAHGAKLRLPSDFEISVTSGVDWFDLDASVDFDGVRASLPALLEAMKSGEESVILDDGSRGMLPNQWLKQFVGLENSSVKQADGKVRFNRTQALLLDAMLADHADVQRDSGFGRLVNKLRSFDGVRPVTPGRAFRGSMRDYQKEGLGWFKFLREFGFGGCLADDMGLGKTIQVLALLDRRRARRLRKDESRKPSIVVVPKSLVFNWIDEGREFTPKLRILNYTGTERKERWENTFEGEPPHVIVTTYGTLRNDAALLREQDFDYAILDEAQAIKNEKSLANKAARLLQSDHKLALTGTPVENHLGDLWSLFDFLNPGMLDGTLQRRGKGVALLEDEEQRKRIEQVSQSLRPFILRRTKEEVLDELPEKTEQSLKCEMGKKQRSMYNELRDHYRASLTKKVSEVGLKRSKIHVLEALLRLRQAACDPRLVDPDCGVRGSKIDTLLEQLTEVIGEGHKALVFSQFTSLLGLLREDLAEKQWDYEYLDGKTRKRAEKVKRFQQEDDCKLFLISLKAGGNGLNLTAADYVFILDPWWNPAVEAQAIDRAHRMGQVRCVNAYRMVCADSVEEKIIELQQAKRELASAIISQDKSLIGELTSEDLQQLLA